MKKYICITLLAATALIFSACGNLLDEQSQSEVIPRTTEDFSELLIGSAYPDGTLDIGIISYMDDDCQQFLTYSNNDTWSGTVYYPDQFAGTTDAVNPAPYYQWQPYESDLNGYQEEINTSAASTIYYQFYSKIKGCNAVLDEIDGAIGSDEQRNRVKAEALAVRAFLYFGLVNLYGEPYNYNKESLGVPLKLDASLSQEPLTRATVAKAYEEVILPDLLESAKLMDPLKILRKNNRINQPAIHILLSRVYLYMERWQDAIDEVNKALSQGAVLFNLVTNYDPNASVPSGPYYFSYSADPEIEWLIGGTTRRQSSAYMPGCADELRKLYDPQNDLRWEMYKLHSGQWDNDNTFVINKPYGSQQFSQFVRTSEAWLNKMEAEAMLGKDAAAMKDLNDFRKTRVVGYVDENLSGDALLTAIKNERRKELCFEGHRWFDLRRWGMPEIHHVYQDSRVSDGGHKYDFVLRHNDPMYTLPFPAICIRSNSGLVQNECRNGANRVGTLIN